MKKDIKPFITECSTCQPKKSNTLTPAGLLQPFANSTGNTGGSVIEALPKSPGFDTRQVMVERLSKIWPFYSIDAPFPCKGPDNDIHK